MPDNPAGHKLAWVLDLIARGTFDHAELEANFAASFLKAVPDEQMKLAIQQMHGIELGEVKTDPQGMQLGAHATLAGHKLKITMVLDPDQKISGLLFQPESTVEKPASWDAVDAALKAAAPHAQLLAAGLDCKAIHAVDPGTELAIGSTFKLYVLLAIVDAIAAKKLSWDQPIEVRDEWKSLPSGTTQNEPAGTKLTLLHLAQKMISISDNTATDHLLYTVGRDKAEAALATAHHARPALDRPFFSTRELFLLKLGSADERDHYIEMPEARRRTYLDKTLAGKKPELASDWKTARKISRLEWFASSEDLCHAMATLHDRGQQVLDVLSINAGIPFDKAKWPYIGFKGGSEPGVMDLTWLLRRDDNKWFILSLTVNADEGGEVDEDKVIAIAQGAIDQLAK